MYADDTVPFSESVIELQKMIETVNECSTQYGLHINLSKTKNVIFRKRGKTKDNEKWYLKGKVVEVCNAFVYLGLLFNYNGIITVTQKTLNEQGRNAIVSLLSKTYDDFF